MSNALKEMYCINLAGMLVGGYAIAKMAELGYMLLERIFAEK